MQDLSLHILDIVENSIDAGAKKIEIIIKENIKQNILVLKINDNGKGMDKKTIAKVLEQFFCKNILYHSFVHMTFPISIE
ncbi:unnamed protein product [marine sediment metagenome]|uniref:Histidine kinase/HSP90-like ATPase domain-containing protein n=1 Tax=marine sediment metagenome TaxID=412755 RepID=X1LCU9_9ZZZZ